MAFTASQPKHRWKLMDVPKQDPHTRRNRWKHSKHENGVPRLVYLTIQRWCSFNCYRDLPVTCRPPESQESHYGRYNSHGKGQLPAASPQCHCLMGKLVTSLSCQTGWNGISKGARSAFHETVILPEPLGGLTSIPQQGRGNWGNSYVLC